MLPGQVQAQAAPGEAIGLHVSRSTTVRPRNGRPSAARAWLGPVTASLPSAFRRTIPWNTSSNTSSSITTAVMIVAARVSASRPTPKQYARSRPSLLARFSARYRGQLS